VDQPESWLPGQNASRALSWDSGRKCRYWAARTRENAGTQLRLAHRRLIGGLRDRGSQSSRSRRRARGQRGPGGRRGRNAFGAGMSIDKAARPHPPHQGWSPNIGAARLRRDNIGRGVAAVEEPKKLRGPQLAWGPPEGKGLVDGSQT